MFNNNFTPSDKFAALNEPNYNVDTKPSLNLNNKNNTNHIMNSFPNSMAPGNLNSLKRITQFQNLNLNSCFRNNYYTSNSCDFQYMIPSEIKNVVSLRLASIELPNAWYLFSHKQKNNVFN
jgi:predicted S18 family serine protease